MHYTKNTKFYFPSSQIDKVFGVSVPSVGELCGAKMRIFYDLLAQL